MADDTAMWWATPPPYNPPVSEFTTPEDLRRARISQVMGRDVYDGWGGLYNFLVGAAENAPLGLPGLRAGPSPASVYPSRALVQEYTARFGHPPPRDLSAPAIRRWIDSRYQSAPAPDGWKPPATSPVPSSEPGYVPSSPYYASIPRLPPPDRLIGPGGRIVPNPAAATRQRAMQEFEAMQPPPRNRMHSLAPLGALPFLGLNDMGDY